MHFGWKPRTPITNLIGQPSCLLTNWKKTVTKYISAQPTELHVFTIHDSDGELPDYLVSECFQDEKSFGKQEF